MPRTLGTCAYQMVGIREVCRSKPTWGVVHPEQKGINMDTVTEQVQSNSRTRVKASEDRAEAFRLSVGGYSLEEILFHFVDGKGDEGATLDRVRNDIRSIKIEDLVPEDPEGLAFIVFLQDITTKAKQGWENSGSIEFLHLLLSVNESIREKTG